MNDSESRPDSPVDQKTSDAGLGRGKRLGGLAVIDQCFFSGTNFLTSVLLGRYGGAEELGRYTLVFSVAVLLLTLSRSMLISPYVVLRHHLDAQQVLSMRRSMLFVAIGVGILSSVVASAVAFLSGWTILFGLACVIPTLLLRDLMRRIPLCEFRLFTALAVDVVTCVLQVGLIAGVIASQGGHTDALTTLLCCSTAWAIVGVVALILSRDRFLTEKSDIKSDMLMLWPIGRWIGVSHAVSTVQAYALPWLLTAAHSIKAAGLYAACWTLVQVVAPAIEGLGNVLSPALAKSASQEKWGQFSARVRKATIIFLGVMSALVGATLFFGRAALGRLYGMDYADFAHILLLLVIAATFANVTIPASKAMTQLGLASINSLISTVSLIVVVVASLAGLHWIGISGAAWGLIVANGLAAFARFYTYRKLRPRVS